MLIMVKRSGRETPLKAVKKAGEGISSKKEGIKQAINRRSSQKKRR
jgi:hypothetical protein